MACGVPRQARRRSAFLAGLAELHRGSQIDRHELRHPALVHGDAIEPVHVRDMVSGLWVMAMKRVGARRRISSSMLQKRSTLASSSGASTSSITQIGAGLARKTAKINAAAVSACSPPESKGHHRQPLPRRAGVDLQAGLQRVVGFDQPQLRLAALEEGGEERAGSGRR